MLKVRGAFVEFRGKLMKRKAAEYFLAIDGGATKTEFALADHTKNIIRTLVLESCNPVDIGMDAAQNILKKGIFEICDTVPLSSVSMYAGISGGGVGENAKILHDFFATLGFCSFDNGNDALTIVSAGLGEGDGVAIIMGTGTVAYVQKDGELIKLSGLGYLFDNGGNGYCFGRDALRAAMIAEYDPDSYTEMLPLVREKLGCESVTKKIPEIYALGKRGIASFARIPFTAARAGDRIALELLDKNMKEIADILHVAGKRLPDAKHIRTVFVGSLTKEDDLLFPLIRAHLPEQERFDFVIMRDAPILGAIKLASQLD